MKKHILFLSFFTISLIFGQDTLIDLKFNSSPWTKNKTYRILGTIDTLSLPFIDDFGGRSVYPNENLWTQSNVFINDYFALNPPDKGVATFDAIDKNGSLYHFKQDTLFSADSLISLPIDLNNSDKVVLTFFYQPKGLGESPDINDTLQLDFYSPTNKWVPIWKAIFNETENSVTEWFVLQGNTSVWQPQENANSLFKQVDIAITEPAFLSKGFRLRFKNKVSYNALETIKGKIGNADIWNIDFIYLDKNRDINHPVINDVGFTSSLKSILKDYEVVPWSHYLSSSNAGTNTVHFAYKNKGPSPVEIRERRFEMIDSFTNIKIFEDLKGKTTLNEKEKRDYSLPLNMNQLDNTDNTQRYFLIQSSFQTDTPDLLTSNNIIKRVQAFEGFYAYDDGSAEVGYGISGINASEAKIALKFTPLQTGTIQACDIYFNQTLDSVNENLAFNIYIWKDDNGKPGKVIYRSEPFTTTYSDKLNKFIRYQLNNNVEISNEFYVGIEQLSNNFLNIGFDQNNINNTKLFFNTSGNWINSSLLGTIMIRPVFHQNLTSTGLVDEDSDVNIFPNPVQNKMQLILPDKYLTKNLKILIYNAMGDCIIHRKVSDNFIDMEDIEVGIYFLQILDTQGETIYNKKIIVSH